MTISDSLGANRKTVATENQVGEKTEKTLSLKKVLGKKEKKEAKIKSGIFQTS